MGKQRTPEQVLEELKEATREANAILGDIRRELRGTAQETLSRALADMLNDFKEVAGPKVDQHLGEFVSGLKVEYEKFEKAIRNRMDYIATMTGTDTKTGALLAGAWLMDNGGTVELGKDDKTGCAKRLHLIAEEEHEHDDVTTFAFGPGIRKRMDSDPKVRAQMSKALEKLKGQQMEWSEWREGSEK